MRDVKFGLHLPNVRGYTDFDHLKDLTLHAEDIGLDSVWTSDHLLYPESYLEYFGSTGMFEALTTLSALATLTKRIILGTSILLPLRHPLMEAAMLSTLDHASKGRLIVGFGVGWYDPEFQALGVPFRERGRVEDEAIELLLALWTKPSVTHEGRFFRLTDVRLEPKPYQQPHPPILIGGTPRYAARRVARFGGGWLPFCPTLEQFAAGIEKIREACEAADRSFDDLVFAVDLWSSIHRDRGTARERAEFLVRYFGKPLDRIEQSCAIGSPDEVVERLREYVDLGARHIVLGFPPAGRETEHMDLLAEEVIGQL